MNPFEPWRPSEQRIPPPLHAGRPWRPPLPPRLFEEVPPIVEPVDRRKTPKKANNSRKSVDKKPASRPTGNVRPRTDPWIVVGMFLLLAFLGLLGLANLGETHLPRLLTALSAAALGFCFGISILRQRDWPLRLSWMAGGLVAACLAGWFVPTTRGVSLWSAYRQLHELRVLAADDLTAYNNGAAARRIIVDEFPSFADDVHAAEQAWLRRTLDAAIEDADQTRITDPDKALADLQRLETSVEHQGLTGDMRKELRAAQDRARRTKAIADQK